MLNPEKIRSQHHTDLSTSPVTCSHMCIALPLEVQKSFSTILFMNTYFTCALSNAYNSYCMLVLLFVTVN